MNVSRMLMLAFLLVSFAISILAVPSPMIENHQTNIELDLVDSSDFDPASDGYLVLVTRVDDLVDNTNDNELVAERVVQVEFKFDVTPDDEIVCNGQVVPSGSSVLEIQARKVIFSASEQDSAVWDGAFTQGLVSVEFSVSVESRNVGAYNVRRISIWERILEVDGVKSLQQDVTEFVIDVFPNGQRQHRTPRLLGLAYSPIALEVIDMTTASAGPKTVGLDNNADVHYFDDPVICQGPQSVPADSSSAVDGPVQPQVNQPSDLSTSNLTPDSATGAIRVRLTNHDSSPAIYEKKRNRTDHSFSRQFDAVILIIAGLFLSVSLIVLVRRVRQLPSSAAKSDVVPVESKKFLTPSNYASVPTTEAV